LGKNRSSEGGNAWHLRAAWAGLTERVNAF